MRSLALDLHWHKEGKKVLFPLPEVVDKMLEAQFQISSKEGLDWPYKSVVISIPSNCNASPILSIMVTFVENREKFLEIMTAPHHNAFNVDPDAFSDAPPEASWFLVETQSRKNGGVMGTTHTFPSSMLHEITSKSKAEGEELEGLNIAVRLIGGIAVLNKITSGKIIEKGPPERAFRA